MRKDDPSNGDALAKYVAQRARLAGRPLLAQGHVYLKPLDSLRAQFEAQGGRLVSFANYDYLGLSQDSRVKNAACTAAMELGVGASASRLVGGEREIHGAMEREIAEFLGAEDALALVSGYMANLTFVGHLMTKRDLILVDEFSHNSIMVGTEVSRATIDHFPHNDLDALEDMLRARRGDYERVLVIVEGLYSMDGDIPDLPRLLALRESYGVWIMVDEAHSIGVLGETGRGLTEHFGVDPNEVDFIIGTLSKTFVSVGGFIVGRREVLDWLRFTLPGFVYSVGLPPMIAAAVRAVIAILREEPWRVARLRDNSEFFVAEARKRGLDVGSAAGAGVIPILFDDLQKCMVTAGRLLEAGYYAPPIVQVGVPRDKPRIRCFISAAHSHKDIVGMLDSLAAIVAEDMPASVFGAATIEAPPPLSNFAAAKLSAGRT